jgi:hypothetical protein
VTASLSRTAVQVGERVVLSVTAQESNEYPQFTLPDLGDRVRVYDAGNSSRVSIVNGQRSSIKTRNIALVPLAEGTYSLGALEVAVDGKTYRTGRLTLTATAGAPPPSPPPPSTDAAGEAVGDDVLFARAVVDKANPYQYEQVTLRVQLYTVVRLLDNPGYTEPTTQGFWREALPSPQPRIEVLDGKRYTVLEVAMALFPTAPGKLTIGEAIMECTTRAEAQSRDPFSIFREPGRQVVLRTKPVTIDVKPLPVPAPAGYGGAVGDYRLTASVDPRETTQGEPVTLTVTLSGTGSLRTVPEITVPALANFRAYPSRSDQEITRTGGGIGGTVTRQFVLVPLTAGTHTIPAVELPVFSPPKGQYETLRTQPVTIEAAPGSGTGSAVRGDIELLGRDIRFIETDVPSFRPVGSTWRRARLWLFLLSLPTLAYAGVWWWERRRRRLGANRVLRRRQGAARAARAVLKGAGRAAGGDRAAEAGRALRIYLADRYDLPRAGLTPDTIAPCLEREGIEGAPVLDQLAACDAARYAPGESDARRDWTAEVDGWIRRLEKAR